MALQINAAWWEHLLPKRMLSRRREVARLLQAFAKSDHASPDWLRMATSPGGVFRLRPGNVIPRAHIVFLGDRPGFVGKPGRIRVGHRMVSTPGDFASGKDLAEDEIVVAPTITIEIVSDRALIDAAVAGQTKIDESLVRRPSQVFSVPAQLLLAPTAPPKRAFVLYQHIFGHGGSYPDDGFFYVGVTTRSWQKRWQEHRRAIETDSPLLFHRRFREEQAAGRLTYVHHKVMAVTDNVESLYATEEFLVEGHWPDRRRLNMIPGGKSGLKYLREHGLLSPRVVPMPDDRDRILGKWLADNPRKGLPAPWVSEKWKDDEWAVAQICGRDGRLSVEQVRAIRALAERYSAEDIATRIGARNAEQVQRVLDGKTYTRVT